MVRAISVEPTGRARIGARLRAARQRQGLTLENLATSTGVTKSFLSRIERDETSPSVSTLQNICEVLSVPVGSLFGAPALDLVRQGDAPGILLVGEGAHERLLTPRAQPLLQLVRSSIGPGGSGGPDFYTLNCEVEVVHVLLGRLEVSMSEETVTLEAGDTLTFSGREPHTWRNPDPSAPAEAIWAILPASWHTPPGPATQGPVATATD